MTKCAAWPFAILALLTAGAFRDAGLMLGLLLGLLLVAQLLGKAWNRLVHRRVET